MTKITLQANASGTGTVNIAAPNTSATRTLTLPDADVNLGTAFGAGTTAAWVNFNGTGTVAIRDSGNVASITDNGTGLYTTNFSAALPSGSYAATSMSQEVTGVSFNLCHIKSGTTPTTSSVQVTTMNSGGTATDAPIVGIHATV